ncbi:uncharacterized protein BJ171DRAFT_518825 [Polychytrium aggregatum]|uniref:uncharacterized protein n=1 Tax=Polychytrium aggregatum TaxID=110093 RepID=UPI0022FF2B20|nr:uncharacterized protein BJ171DRAFT_518825 [Polychytrium aggregatum]KAI9199337.1 hypothetical protein BJ171DRAFT_518825 [Polychytrium aggregatum]
MFLNKTLRLPTRLSAVVFIPLPLPCRPAASQSLLTGALLSTSSLRASATFSSRSIPASAPATPPSSSTKASSAPSSSSESAHPMAPFCSLHFLEKHLTVNLDRALAGLVRKFFVEPDVFQRLGSLEYYIGIAPSFDSQSPKGLSLLVSAQAWPTILAELERYIQNEKKMPLLLHAPAPLEYLAYTHVEPIAIQDASDYKAFLKKQRDHKRQIKSAESARHSKRSLDLAAARAVSDSGTLFLALDIENYERDQNIVLEIGWTIWDPSIYAPWSSVEADSRSGFVPQSSTPSSASASTSTSTLASGAGSPPADLQWSKVLPKGVIAKHFLIKENRHLSNGTFVPDNRYRYSFGTTQFQSLRKVCEELRRDLALPGQIVVGHALHGDAKMLESIGITVASMESYDTQRVYQGLTGKPEVLSLTRMAQALGIPARHLHNAGNDACYTMQIFITILTQRLGEAARTS